MQIKLTIKLQIHKLNGLWTYNKQSYCQFLFYYPVQNMGYKLVWKEIEEYVAAFVA